CNPSWTHFAECVSGGTRFGSEALTCGVDRAEESRTVNERQGTHLWRWHLSSKHLHPSFSADGSVRFTSDGKNSDFRILPVAILDHARKDVTPAGSRWSLSR